MSYTPPKIPRGYTRLRKYQMILRGDKWWDAWTKQWKPTQRNRSVGQGRLVFIRKDKK